MLVSIMMPGVLLLLTVLVPASSVAATATTTTTMTLLTGNRTMQCYSCTWNKESDDDGNHYCEKDPASVAHGILAGCRREVCTIVRVEEWPLRRVKSFYRGCDGRSKVFEKDHCLIEGGERTCFSSCVGDLCNVGDGLADQHDKGHLSASSRSSQLGSFVSPVLVIAFILHTR